MEKIVHFTGPILGVLFVAALFNFGRHKIREHKEHRQRLAQDEMTLPSQSQCLMRLADTLAPAQRDTLFRNHNLAKLFLACGQNGFWGPHEQRLEVTFTQVRRDAVGPGTFRVTGLVRVASRISHLTGTIELRQARYFFDNQNAIYIATGHFCFQQYSAGKHLVAHWDGLAAIDFEVETGEVKLFAEEGAIRARSRQFAFEGSRTDVINGKKQRVLWANEFAPVANAVLGDFDIGGRMAAVNPKYRKYGWTEYFENDEWWADSPKPKLSL